MILKIDSTETSLKFMEVYHPNVQEGRNVYQTLYEDFFKFLTNQHIESKKLIKRTRISTIEDSLNITIIPTVERLLLFGVISDLDFIVEKYKSKITVDIVINTIDPNPIKIIFASLQRLDLIPKVLGILEKK